MQPDIDPVAFSIGPISVHWYGLMYLVGFVGGYLLGVYRSKSAPGWDKEQVSDLLFHIAVGVIVGGRLGYVLFYKFAYYLSSPLEIFYVWQGGMSFHGGLLGVLVALLLFGRRTQRSFLQVTDFVAPLVPLGLGAGRIGNFINQELWGRATEFPLAMVFPRTDPTLTARHPSMLYEACLEGLVMFVVLWWFSSRPRRIGAVSGMFLLCYGVFRFLVEFVREPDAHLGYLAWDWLTMGQILSMPMIGFGVWLLARESATSSPRRSKGN